MNVFTIMKKTLLTSAFAVMALAASAQSQVASPAGEFEFIPKNLTVGGKIIPVSMVKDEENGKYDFTIYNSSFNTERIFTLPLKKYTYHVKLLQAQAPLTVTEVLDKDDSYAEPIEWTNPTTGEKISTIEDWKIFVSQRFGSDWVVFTDTDGNFAAHRSNGWMDLSEESSDGIIMRQDYVFYNASNNELMKRDTRVKCSVNTDNLTWKEVSSDEGSVSSEIMETDLKDYDANCAESYDSYLTQSLFNNDEKFEAVMKAYKEVPASEADDNNDGNFASTGFPYAITGVDGDKVTLQKTEQDKYYKSCISIVNEDGKELVTLPEESGSHYFKFAKADGKLYMMVDAYNNGKEQTIIYSVDNVNTSITELARTNAVKSRKTFNMAGMQVSKDAKGIVIQQGGKKYINK